MAPLGYKPRFINSTLAVLIAYIANLGIPRSGEILRATTLSSYEKIPFEKTFGTIIAERLVDLIILLGFILIALTLQFDLRRALTAGMLPYLAALNNGSEE